MRYATVCSGIEAPSVAWGPLGWEPVWFSEIEPFPCAVLKHHYPDVPNLGDMTEIDTDGIDRNIDVLIGGTPCQSFSVAGLRAGLDDPRGNLALVYLSLVDRLRPAWCIWENVPGVLSSGGGRDFGAILGALSELRYGWAYRILDAQWYGVPQRRRRVFLVGHSSGQWQRAAAVLFDTESLSGNPPPCREKGEGTAGHFAAGAYNCRANQLEEECSGTLQAKKTGGWSLNYQPVAVQPMACDGHSRYRETDVCEPLRRSGGDCAGGSESLLVQPYPVANTLTRRMHKGINTTLDEGQTPVITMSSGQANAEVNKDKSAALTCLHEAPIVVNARQDPIHGYTTGALDTDGGMRAVAFPINGMTINKELRDKQTTGIGEDGDPCPSLRSAGHQHAVVTQYGNDLAGTLTQRHDSSPCADRGQNVVASQERGRTEGRECDSQEELAYSLNSGQQGGERNVAYEHYTHDYCQDRIVSADGVSPALNCQQRHQVRDYAVRRLVPEECESLQGFPRNYTRIPWRKKPAEDCPDSPRYKALGNSMAVPVVRWIGERIQQVENIEWTTD